MKLFDFFRKQKPESIQSIKDYSFYSGHYMAQWTEQQINLGQPATMKDFFIYHGVCPDCQGAGQWNVNDNKIGDGLTRGNMMKICDTCKGTGRITNGRST